MLKNLWFFLILAAVCGAYAMEEQMEGIGTSPRPAVVAPKEMQQLANNAMGAMLAKRGSCTAQYCMQQCREVYPDKIITSNTRCMKDGGCMCEYLHRCGTDDCDKSCRQKYGPTFRQNCTGGRAECWCDEACEEQRCFDSCEKIYPDMQILKSMCIPNCWCQYNIRCNTTSCTDNCKQKYGSSFQGTACVPKTGICQCVERCDENGCLKNCMESYPPAKGRYVKSGVCAPSSGVCHCNFGVECNSPMCEEMCRKDFGNKYTGTQRCANGKDCVCMLKDAMEN